MLFPILQAKRKVATKFWVDWNEDKKFTDDDKLMGTETVKDDERFVVFGPIERTLNGRKLEVYLLPSQQFSHPPCPDRLL